MSGQVQHVALEVGGRENVKWLRGWGEGHVGTKSPDLWLQVMSPGGYRIPSAGPEGREGSANAMAGATEDLQGVSLMRLSVEFTVPRTLLNPYVAG